MKKRRETTERSQRRDNDSTLAAVYNLLCSRCFTHHTVIYTACRPSLCFLIVKPLHEADSHFTLLLYNSVVPSAFVLPQNVMSRNTSGICSRIIFWNIFLPDLPFFFLSGAIAVRDRRELQIRMWRVKHLRWKRTNVAHVNVCNAL